MKILKLPDPIKCSCCGCEFEYDDRDIFESYNMTEGESTVTFNVYVECPICKQRFSIREDIEEETDDYGEF